MKRKDIKRIIAEYFFSNPTVRIRVRQIERTLKLPLPSVIKYCKELKKEGILAKERIGNVFFYKANRENEKYLLEKKLYNIKQLYETGLIEFIRKELANPSIVVFGSYAKGEDIEKSDIDLYIETPSKKEIDLKNFEVLLNRRIQIFQHKKLKDIKNPHLANNIVNGIVLNGFIEVFR